MLVLGGSFSSGFYRYSENIYYLKVIFLEFFAKLLSILDTQMKEPGMYSAFHVFFILLSILAGFFFIKHCANRGESYIRRYLLIGSLLLILLEIYKQINFSFRYEGGSISFDYQWYAFPFQFCSTPMYIGLLAAIVKKDSIHRRLCSYLASYSLFAGIAVMAYPSTVFVGTIGINIQTMVCHGFMVTTGMVLLGSGYVKAELKTVAQACSIFIFLILCAMAMNELAYRTGLLENDTFNMFFISPYCDPELPVYSLVQGVVPYPVDVLLYIFGFTVAVCLILSLMNWLMCKANKLSFLSKEASVAGF